MDRKQLFANKFKSAILDMFTVENVDCIVQTDVLDLSGSFRIVVTFRAYGKTNIYRFNSQPFRLENLEEIECRILKDTVLLFASSYFDILRKE